MLTVHQPLFEHLNNRKRNPNVFLDYVATRDAEVGTYAYHDEETLSQNTI